MKHFVRKFSMLLAMFFVCMVCRLIVTPRLLQKLKPTVLPEPILKRITLIKAC